MYKKILLIAIFALLGAAGNLRAQYYETYESEDTQLHTALELSGKINSRWSWNFGEELYFSNNMSTFQKIYTRVMVGYNITPNLRVAPLVLNIVDRINDTRTMIYDLNLLYTFKIDALSITLREGLRIQDLYFQYGEQNPAIVKSKNPDLMARTQVALKYRLNDTLEPFANCEAFLMLNPATSQYGITVGHYLPRVRSNVGLKMHFDTHNALSLYWRYDRTQSKYLNFELADGPYGIITKRNTNNFLGVTYDYLF